MTKSSGPRTEPWGTPQEEVCQDRAMDTKPETRQKLVFFHKGIIGYNSCI